jgi:hypothetical protein
VSKVSVTNKISFKILTIGFINIAHVTSTFAPLLEDQLVPTEPPVIVNELPLELEQPIEVSPIQEFSTAIPLLQETPLVQSYKTSFHCQ